MIKKITIVGGGSAGWMTASALKRYFPNKEIILIESKQIPTIGVGESTTAFVKHFINSHLKIEDKTFVKGVDAIYKMAAQFNDFYHLNDEGFFYPFGQPFLNDLEPYGIESWDLVKYFNTNLPRLDFNYSLFPASHLFLQNKIDENLNNNFDNFDFQTDCGYHLDANKLGNWLKTNYCLPKGVKHIVANVVQVHAMNDYVDFIQLDNGDKLHSDLFIDCTGFKRLLISQMSCAKFIDLSYRLPNNRAWATPSQYKNLKKEMMPYTKATALKNGWVWYTPIASRIGNGYSYSDKYISRHDALEEFKNYLISEKNPLTLSRDEVNKLPFFELEMKAGYYQENIIGNVVSIGLSAGFLEPLEGTGLHFIVESILQLCKLLQRPDLNQFLKDSFNQYMKELFEVWCDTLLLFYIQTIRDDSCYWQEIKNKKFSLVTESNFRQNFYGHKSFLSRITKDHSSFGNLYDAYTAISHGCDFSMDIDEITMDRFTLWDRKHVDYYKLSEKYKDIFNLRKQKWQKQSKNSLHVSDFLGIK